MKANDCSNRRPETDESPSRATHSSKDRSRGYL